MSLERARAQLSQVQLSLVIALTRRTDAPADINCVGLEAAADALAAKRAWSVRRAWPALSRRRCPHTVKKPSPPQGRLHRRRRTMVRTEVAVILRVFAGRKDGIIQERVVGEQVAQVAVLG